MIDKKYEEEAVLIGTWLTGDHLEDIRKVDFSMFHYRDIVSKIQRGIVGIEVCKDSNYTYMEIGELMTYSSFTTLYNQALRKMSLRKLEKEAKNFSPSESGIEKLKEQIANVESATVTVKEDEGIADHYIADLNERRNAERVKWSNLPTLNKMTNGIRSKKLITIAGRPSAGKSAFALQMLLGVIESGKKVLYFPLEMSNDETVDRILMHEGIISSSEASSGRVSGENLNKAIDYIRKIEKDGNLKFYEGVHQIENIEAAIKREKPFAVVIDQLSLMSSLREKFNGIRERFTYMTKSLKSIAMSYDVAVVLLCQLNRGADEIEPTLANLKESGSIEEDADIVILISKIPESMIDNKGAHDLELKKPMILNLAKNRSGECGKYAMMFYPSAMAFYEETRLRMD